ncbi:hypothetical protein GTW52_01015 [Streptomyces sp. SID8358]|uniref:hypothetical protein n=2 Tax=unclassified Streptomyces TaxID=2593676 RepID=UPI000DAE69C2|nr:hypothetical protein [Streptomyces sp. SID8358]MYU31717.1 hypothetical protein [Streptomyces sp. SID8358]
MRVVTAPRPTPPAAPARTDRQARRPLPWLITVAVVFVAVQLAVVVPGSGLAWDETVYVSQVGGHAPPAFFSAPRARGTSYLVAPATALTASTAFLRVYLAVLSATALVGALWVWRTLLPTPVLVCAGVFFAGLWPTLFYGSMAMPNLWCALGALAAAGWVARAVVGRAGRAELLGASAAVAVVALLRPADGVWLALPLLLVAVRRPTMLAALVAGLLAGCAPWIVEAFAHHGGPVARLHRAGEIQGGLGWDIAVDDQAKALEGRTLCRPCDIPWKRPGTAVWWAALPFLTVGGVFAARRAGRGGAAVVAGATAVSLAVPYLFLIAYAAPRFLLPAYAVLAVPVAECAVYLTTRVRRAGRPVGLAALALALAGHLAVQLQVLSRVAASSHSTSADYTAVAGALHRLGVRPPCVISGEQAVPIAYYAGCASRQTTGHDARTTPAAVRAAARRVPTAVLVAGDAARPPSYARGWRREFLVRTRGAGPYTGYLSVPVGSPTPNGGLGTRR